MQQFCLNDPIKKEDSYTKQMKCKKCNVDMFKMIDDDSEFCDPFTYYLESDEIVNGRNCKICNIVHYNEYDDTTTLLYGFYCSTFNRDAEICNSCYKFKIEEENKMLPKQHKSIATLAYFKAIEEYFTFEIKDQLAFIGKDKCKKCGNDYYNYPIRSEHGLCIDCVKSLEHMDWNNPIKKSFVFVIAKVEEDLDEKSTKPHCILCEEKAISTINLPCGHATMCNACSINYAKSFINKKESVLCCTCRQPITGNNVLFIQ
jgi:hypothetical protein